MASKPGSLSLVGNSESYQHPLNEIPFLLKSAGVHNTDVNQEMGTST